MKRTNIQSTEATVEDEHSMYVKKKCPYLDTINRQFIDFDSEKLCSITLTNMNVYACLICGKFFQGRGKLTPAYTHSVQMGHFVFMNLLSFFISSPSSSIFSSSSLSDILICCFSLK